MWDPILLIFGCVLVTPGGGSQLQFSPHHSSSWETFKITYEKKYDTREEVLRRGVFLDNLKMIRKHNNDYASGKSTYMMGLNEYSDLESEEIVHTMNGYKQPDPAELVQDASSTYLSPVADVVLPDSVDWRELGYVTDIKNQGECGSCWAFSTTGSLEGQHFRSTGNLTSLSEQQLVDCADAYGPKGCSGGWMLDAFKYIKANKGIEKENNYPYMAQEGSCHFDASHVAATVTGSVSIRPGDEEQLKEAVATQGPVSVAIDASHSSFHSYKSGIYDEPSCSSTTSDHAVLVVGYGMTKAGLDYWIVKNSWGTSWGAAGYIKMSRNKQNQCGIATAASYPLV